MKSFGLEAETLQEIVQLISEYSDIDEALIFGSRAKGTYKDGSDVDLALKGKNLLFETVLKLNRQLNERSNLPYFFDIVDYEFLENKELKDHIDRVGLTVYKKARDST